MKRAKVFKLSKGFVGRAKNNWTIAITRLEKGLSYAYRDRRNKKRDMRMAWIRQITAATRQHGMNYSHFVRGLVTSNISLNRKVLAELAVSEPLSFLALTEESKKNTKWKDLTDLRITDDEIKRLDARFSPESELPEELRNIPNSGIDPTESVMERFEKATKKANEINAELVRTGKVILPKVTTRLMGKDKKLAIKKQKKLIWRKRRKAAKAAKLGKTTPDKGGAPTPAKGGAPTSAKGGAPTPKGNSAPPKPIQKPPKA